MAQGCEQGPSVSGWAPGQGLYVEHNATDIDLTRRHFARHAPHIRLSAVGDAAQALERLESTPDAFDVLLLDYRLPGRDAPELTKVLRLDRGLEIPIVIVTGQGDEPMAAKALQIGFDDFATKHKGYRYELPPPVEKAEREPACGASGMSCMQPPSACRACSTRVR